MGQIIEIINYLPQYIKYIYPGYIVIYSYYFLRGKTLKDTKGTILKAIILSYIMVSSLEKISFSSQLQENFWLLIASLLLAYFAHLLIHSENLSDAFECLGIETTFYNNEIEALQGLNEGVWLVIYLKDDAIVYEGYLHYKEMEEGKRQYISLSGYRKYLYEKGKKEKCIEDFAGKNSEEVVIFYDGIQRIEKRET